MFVILIFIIDKLIFNKMKMNYPGRDPKY